MLLYSAYIAEEFDKPVTFTILPGCVGSRTVEGIAGPRCTFYEVGRHNSFSFSLSCIVAREQDSVKGWPYNSIVAKSSLLQRY